MSLATFWMSRTKLENVGDKRLLEMKSQVDTMIFEFENSRLAASRMTILGHWAERELDKIWPQKERIDAEIARRGLVDSTEDR
jgi:hypothetical protein